ncbi:MopE-related protein [Portibacter lacus]|uniref:T9SS C-terminal target domain-containing protein n=1 Tax=Portibacter lacus TaxID=1099794 RepID=A0AA37WEX5_9BACT|nr:MopE-related protein [Portibacter lacus]GLR19301.1 hypothetical protein GCM10007940_39170 [Portibacter lacus]
MTITSSGNAQHSIAREWNELLLEGIRGDFARPTVHARNLFHTSGAMYDAWAVYDSIAEPYFLGDTVGEYEFKFSGIPIPEDITEARKEAISFAMYRILRHRFLTSPGAWKVYTQTDSLMNLLGYNKNYTSLDYESGNPAALGNYIASEIIKFGLQDGSNEALQYENNYYEAVNDPLVMDLSGNSGISDPNKWQPLTLDVFIDQSGNVIPLNTPEFLSPEWGNVVPFAMKEEVLTTYDGNNGQYKVYHDPTAPSFIQDGLGLNDPYKWGFALVAAWSSHLGHSNDTLIDISPASYGNLDELPSSFDEYKQFYDYDKGGDASTGHPLNPTTGLPYEPNIVSRADYTRVLAEFWADGPDSETPPGHWFTLLNFINDNPLLVKKFEGKGEVLSDLEWDVKSYLALGGTMHDCAVSAWGIKGYYDYIRPVSAIRYMAEKGQSSSMDLPNYHPHGFPLKEGFFELVKEGDPLAGSQSQNVNQVKIFAWKGPNYIADPETTFADVGWILAKDWWPYQRPSFVTPPFAGYVSGHSTYSRAAADLLTKFTGSAFFPGGIGEFVAPRNEFLVFEDGPADEIVLQWATYQDASDQCSLSRIWGGIHPPIDDIPGRKIGMKIATESFEFVKDYFYSDEDQDGFYNYEDCDDNDRSVFPGAVEICDGIDNNCDGQIDEDLEIYTYYEDLDEDGYGNMNVTMDTCALLPPPGFVENADDCDDTVFATNPEGVEICDGIDNNCNGEIDEGLTIYTYYLDSDQDGFGNAAHPLDTCLASAPSNYVNNSDDCNDADGSIYPDALDFPDNDIDEDCSGRDASAFAFVLSDLGTSNFVIHYPDDIKANMKVLDISGKLVLSKELDFFTHYLDLNLTNLTTGLYILLLENENGEIIFRQKLVNP